MGLGSVELFTANTYTSTKTQLASMTTGGTTLSFTYAADGSLTARKLGNTTQASWTYNADGRLLSAGGASLKYNAFGERAVETVTGGGTHFLFSPDGLLLAEHSTTGARVRDYIYLNGQPFAVVDSAGVISYILTDQVGQPEKMLNGAGAIIWQRNAGIFGDTVSQPVGATAANPQRFPGQQFDPYMALHYNYFRDYDPAIGRYIEADPIGLAGGPNLYAYVDGNPVGRVDPLGLETIWEHYTGLPDSYRKNAINAIAGASDATTLGATHWIREQIGANVDVDECSDIYKGGEVAGVVAGTVFGGAAGLRAAGTKGFGREFSHWIPARAGGTRSVWNGNYVSIRTHALSDPYRYRFMPRPWKAANPMPNRVRQQVVRVPNVYKGAAVGGGASAGVAAGDCGC